jgi:hypothetical protein
MIPLIYKKQQPETESSTSKKNAFEILLNSSRKNSLPEQQKKFLPHQNFWKLA